MVKSPKLNPSNEKSIVRLEFKIIIIEQITETIGNTIPTNRKIGTELSFTEGSISNIFIFNSVTAQQLMVDWVPTSYCTDLNIM